MIVDARVIAMSSSMTAKTAQMIPTMIMSIRVGEYEFHHASNSRGGSKKLDYYSNTQS